MGHFQPNIPPLLTRLEPSVKILLTDIRDSSRDVRLSGRLSLPGQDDRMGEGEVEARVHVNPAGERWYLQGSVRGEFPLVCDRCRKTFTASLEGDFTLIVLSRAVRGLEEDENAEVLLLPSYSNELDLSDAVREAMLLALPMQFLCGEDCEGLDPGTGEKRETEEAPEAVDPRWAPLLDLKDKLEEPPASSSERQE